MTERLPALSSKEILRALARAGFYIHHQSGSHVQLKHRTKHHIRLTVPFHGRSLPRAVVWSILRQAELSVEEFRALL